MLMQPRPMADTSRLPLPSLRFCIAILLRWSTTVLLVRDLLHPIHGLAVELFLNRNVRHRGAGRCAVPMLLTRPEPHDVARMNFLNRPAVALRPAAAADDDQRLSQWVRVPSGACARLEGDAGAGDPRGFRTIEQRVNANGTGKPIRRPLGGRL